MKLQRQTTVLIAVIIFLASMLAAGLTKRGAPGPGNEAFPEAQTEPSRPGGAG